MGKYLKQLTDILELGYSVRSGVYSAVDSSIHMELDAYGQYKYVLPSGLDENSAHKLLMVDNMSDYSPNENVIADKLFSKVRNINKDKILGYYKDLYAGHVVESDYRAIATSGGMGTWILVSLLKKNEIDGVIHVHACDPKDNDGKLFEYAVSRTIKDIKKGAKSRYYPMELSEVLKTVKDQKGKYAVVGIPEFIMELRLLSEVEPVFKERIVYMVGLICGHQKSTKYAEAMAWNYGIKPGALEAIDFRVKRSEGVAWDYLASFSGKQEGSSVSFSKLAPEMFVTNWAHGMFKTKFSDYTDNPFNELADIVIGDAWSPQYDSDSRGNNVIIVRNPVIAKIIKEGIKEKRLKLDRVAPEVIINSQRGLVRHTRDELPYRLFRRREEGVWYPKKRVKVSAALPEWRQQVQDVREELAVKSHELYAKAVKRKKFSYFMKSMKPYISTYEALYGNVDKGPWPSIRLAIRPRTRWLKLKQKVRIRTRIRSVEAARKEGKLFYALYKKIAFLSRSRKKRVFIFGAPFHSNLGDQAQTYCMEAWYAKHFHDYSVLSIDTLSAFQMDQYLIKKVRDTIRPDDKIVLHSGYHTTDLWDMENRLNLTIIDTFPDFHITVFPQTVHFESHDNLMQTAATFNSHGNITLMCRDEQSYDTARKYFNKVELQLMPDVVTSLVGTRDAEEMFTAGDREGILMCFRNDKESKYGKDVDSIKRQVSKITSTINQADTTIEEDPYYLGTHRREVLSKFFSMMAHHRLVVTDRYHGTIFAVITNTPVIVLGSTDHKLSSGVKWFSDKVFSDVIHYAESPGEAVKMVKELYGRYDFSKKIPPVFNEQYWDKAGSERNGTMK